MLLIGALVAAGAALVSFVRFVYEVPPDVPPPVAPAVVATTGKDTAEAEPTRDETPPPAAPEPSASAPPPSTAPTNPTPAPAVAQQPTPSQAKAAVRPAAPTARETIEERPAPASQPSAAPAIAREPTPPPSDEPFDRSAAASALATSAEQASACRQEGDPSGTASVVVTFAPSGRVTSATINGPPFAGTKTGGCIAASLRRARVPPFAGDKVTVSKTVVIR